MEQLISNAMGRWYRPAVIGLTVTMVGILILEVVVGVSAFGWWRSPGVDLDIYLIATRRVLTGGSWFLDRQLDGPYDLLMGDILYPPITIALFLPFLVVPTILWWAPIAVTGWLIWSWKPSAGAWPLMSLCLVYPMVPARIITGNPAMWITMVVALGLRYRWPAALVLLKPSLFPFALIGVRSRGWWMVVAILLASSLVLAPLTIQWVEVATAARGAGLLYSAVDIPMLLLPVIAWRARTSTIEGSADV
jgi:hypothetical protein